MVDDEPTVVHYCIKGKVLSESKKRKTITSPAVPLPSTQHKETQTCWEVKKNSKNEQGKRNEIIIFFLQDVKSPFSPITNRK